MNALQAELEKLEAEYAEADEAPEVVDQRLGEIETELAAFEERPVVYDAAEIERAGAFVSIDSAGVLRVERGYVRPEDEPPIATVDGDREDDAADLGMMMVPRSRSPMRTTAPVCCPTG